MPRKGKVQKKSHGLVPHEVGRYACPLRFPAKTGQTCPIGHDQGCLTTLPTSSGAFARHPLDRHRDEFTHR
jgi:hypothetical protein